MFGKCLLEWMRSKRRKIRISLIENWKRKFEKVNIGFPWMVGWRKYVIALLTGKIVDFENDVSSKCGKEKGSLGMVKK